VVAVVVRGGWLLGVRFFFFDLGGGFGSARAIPPFRADRYSGALDLSEI
jgi:hypothetical protein